MYTLFLWLGKTNIADTTTGDTSSPTKQQHNPPAIQLSNSPATLFRKPPKLSNHPAEQQHDSKSLSYSNI